ncbi:MAG: hypothetical protein R3F49_08810 [Planctomycetota bacterium]
MKRLACLTLLALAFAPSALALVQAPVVAPNGPGRAVTRVSSPSGPYLPYLNGGRVTQLGLLHSAGLETFGLFRPGPLPAGLSSERPLVVFFHSYGGDGDGELEAYTRFSDEADQRHWYVLAPDQDVPLFGIAPNGSSRRRKTFGSDEAQRRLDLTLRWVLENYPIDRERIYGVGFSMGGGDMLSYAAQHRNPARGAFAAVAVNAGTLCLSQEYWRNPASQDALQVAVGGGAPPNANNAFDFERLSSLRYASPFGSSVLDLGVRHPVQNLVGVPIQAWIDTREPSSHLTDFVDDLELVLGPSQPTGLFQRHDVLGTGPSAHVWETFDFTQVCNSLAAQRLVVPDVADLLVSRDARYGDVRVTRVNSREFGELRHDFSRVGVPGMIDRVSVVDCVNIARVELDAAVLGIGMASAAYQVQLEGNPNRSVRLDLKGVSRPLQVLRNGVDLTQSPGTAWAYQAATSTLVLVSAANATDLWALR